MRTNKESTCHEELIGDFIDSSIIYRTTTYAVESYDVMVCTLVCLSWSITCTPGPAPDCVYIPPRLHPVSWT